MHFLSLFVFHFFLCPLLFKTNSCKYKIKKHTKIEVYTLQIILEGMGRALHTNFNAQFKCDALKVRLYGVVYNLGCDKGVEVLGSRELGQWGLKFSFDTSCNMKNLSCSLQW